VRTGRVLWFTLPTVVLTFAGASSPWVAQRAPRFLFPAVAAAGAALIVFSFVSSLVQSIRRRRVEGRLSFFPVVVNVVAMVFLVLLPTTHLVRAVTPRETELRESMRALATGWAQRAIRG